MQVKGTRVNVSRSVTVDDQTVSTSVDVEVGPGTDLVAAARALLAVVDGTAEAVSSRDKVKDAVA
jgi:hypothetical protein